MTTQIYELPAAWVELMDSDNIEEDIAALNAELTATFHETPNEYIDAVRADLLRTGLSIKTLEANEDVLKLHLADVNARLAAITARKDRMKAWTLNICNQTGIDKAKSPLVTVWTQDNPASVEVDNEADVPLRYKRATVSMPYSQALELLPDDVLETAFVAVQKQAILTDVKDTGEAVPGVTVVSDRKHVRVR